MAVSAEIQSLIVEKEVFRMLRSFFYFFWLSQLVGCIGWKKSIDLHFLGSQTVCFDLKVLLVEWGSV